jgi:3-oxoacyl-[acyl-carrier-protein] synthase-3
MRLGLSKGCAAFDVGLGCSGYVYGLWIVSSIMAASGFKRALLLAGDQSTCTSSSRDRSTALLFGDAGTATALELDDTASPMTFSLGTDGRGWNKLIIPTGLQFSRTPRTTATSESKESAGGNWRSAEELYMDGAEIFAFTLREVAPMVREVLAAAKLSAGDIDHFVLHQANRFMINHLVKSMKLPLDRVPLSLQEYGNTSSASIPLTINARLGVEIASRKLQLLLAGFGVGYSWGACALDCGPIVAPPVIEVEDSEAWTC